VLASTRLRTSALEPSYDVNIHERPRTKLAILNEMDYTGESEQYNIKKIRSQFIKLRQISCSHSGEYEDNSLLEYCTV
jgi:hypothetical protein